MVHDSDRMPNDRAREEEKCLFTQFYTKSHLAAGFFFVNYNDNNNLLIQM